ncbi:hypothetical protein PybrP1_007903 [[Pythium] brassicae (nom. inval.)]|nr:hypothetical protein PybrP1_007903 [[Pythium] brassicae (nom. inval.)]
MTTSSASIDIFNALYYYMSKCIQSTSSLKVGFAIILVDLAQKMHRGGAAESGLRATQAAAQLRHLAVPSARVHPGE